MFELLSVEVSTLRVFFELLAKSAHRSKEDVRGSMERYSRRPDNSKHLTMG